MHRRVSGSLAGFIAAAALASGLAGCNGSAVGDPCVPEAIPNDGFKPEEVYLETSSVQCRTRTCMVYHLDGHPERLNPDDIDHDGTCPGPAAHCVNRSYEQQHVFCSCRCGAGADGDVNTPLCQCGQGYMCQEIVTAGMRSVRGSYCVPCTYENDPRDPPLDATFPACPVP